MPTRRTAAPARFWLIKSEPASYSIDDLARDRTTGWDGVRNYQARNFLRDSMRKGDLVLFYQSSGEPTGVAGVAKVTSRARPDVTALDKKDHHHDPKATSADPIWTTIDVAFVEKFERVVTLAELRERKELAGMAVLKRGQRLSIQPVTREEFEVVRAMGRG